MRTVAMEVASTKGRARVYRCKDCVIVEVALLDGDRRQIWTTNAGDEKALDKLARQMQTTLDGVYGTNGDVAG